MNKTKQRLLAFTVLLMVSVSVILFPFGAGANVYAAELSETEFEKTNVMYDLKSSEGFNILDYPFYDSETPEIKVINVVEYCYSFKTNMRSNFGLYLYVYNPNGQDIVTDGFSNKVQMAISYDSEGNPNDYEKFALQFCSVSTESNYYRLFYKFKVIDHKSNKDGKTLLERVNSLERRYDISGIELLTRGNNTATEYPVNGTYKFTGYAKGYGPDAEAESTLTSDVQFLETIELDVHHTFYRTKSSSKGAGYQNQLDTVYFSVPERFFETYGTLQRIKAEWYEYKTKDIVVTSNSDFYERAYEYLGIQTGEFDQYGMTQYNEAIGYSLGQNAGDAGGGFNAAQWGWNLGSGYLHRPAPALYYLFFVNNISEYDPYADIVENGGVTSNALYEYIRNYKKTFDSGRLEIKDGSISADLFADDIDDYRKMDTEFGKIQKGYSYYDFDADVDLQHLASWQESNPGFWDNWVNWGLFEALFGNIPKDESITISPIYLLQSGDLNGTNPEICERLLINNADVSALRSFASEAERNNERVVLFRFATSDYYSAAVDIMQLNQGFMWSDKHITGQAYRAYESVFLDFDIIQLTFFKDGVYHVIPVVSSPIDIVDAITPPVTMPDDTPWWKIVLAVLALILLCLLLWPVLPYIFKGLIWLICLPFRLISKLFKATANSAEKRRREKENEKQVEEGKTET